jgi:hypothetical protein
MDSHPLDGDDAFSGDYRTVAPDQLLSKTFRDAYWARVKQALRDVFRGDEKEADGARKRLDDFEELKGQPQTIFYHADPFEVAADLAGRRGQEVTPDEKARYQQVLRQAERPPASDVNAMHPEDA